VADEEEDEKEDALVPKDEKKSKAPVTKKEKPEKKSPPAEVALPKREKKIASAVDAGPDPRLKMISNIKEQLHQSFQPNKKPDLEAADKALGQLDNITMNIDLLQVSPKRKKIFFLAGGLMLDNVV